MPVANLTSEQLAERTRRAVAAAVFGGRELGLTVSAGEVSSDAFSVIVRLAPAPVIVRVPVVLPAHLTLAAQAARQERELSIVRWLRGRGVPVVAPSPLVPAKPLQRDGFSMTFWERVEVEPATTTSYAADARHVARLHAALQSCTEPLPFLAPVLDTVPGSLDSLQQSPELIAPEDLERAGDEWQRVAPVLASPEAFRRTFPDASLQVIHGDAPAYNLVRTPEGPLFADFEDTTFGPPEWDLAGFGAAAAARYDAAASELGLRRLDRDVLRVMDCARSLQTVASLALTPQLPALRVWLAPWLEQWRASPFAGGLS